MNLVLRTILIAFATCLLTSCSAAILSIGEEEYSVIHKDSKRGEIVAILGEPVESARIEPAKALSDILKERRKENQNLELLGVPQVVREDSKGAITFPEATIISREIYVYDGRIERNTDVGEAASLAGFTWGLSEIVMVPVAIKMQAERSNQRYVITVWYDESQTALAYFWETKEKPNARGQSKNSE